MLCPSGGDPALATLSGRVYGTLLNHRSALANLGDSVSALPYKEAPKAPVLYIKPRNTLALSGTPVLIPHDIPRLEVGACLGLVIGKTACRLRLEDALEYIDGYVIVNDISVPHDSYYRPAIRFKARDGFCPIGPVVAPVSSIENPDAVRILVHVDGKLVTESSTADLVRPVRKLLADVTDFMTLNSGDVLAVGVAHPAPRASAGQTVRITIDGIGHLENAFVQGPGARS